MECNEGKADARIFRGLWEKQECYGVFEMFCGVLYEEPVEQKKAQTANETTLLVLILLVPVSCAGQRTNMSYQDSARWLSEYVKRETRARERKEREENDIR
jgi:hypothetical protein